MSRLLVQRLAAAALLLGVVMLAAATTYWYLGHGRWPWFDCLYFTVVTLATVGFGETLPGFEHVRFARGFTMGLIFTGTGALVYVASTITALVVESDLRQILRFNRMRRKIENLENHVIVCGIGRTGTHTIEELLTTRTPCVAVDTDRERMEKLLETFPDLHYVVGDATEDDTLRAAGIERARGLVAALTDDKENLYITLSARAANPKLRIVTKGIELSAEPKLRRAGADRVVSPNMIGGLRLASEVIRPHVVEFLDLMMRDPEHVLRIEQAVVSEQSEVRDKKLGEIGLRRTCDVLVIAVVGLDGKRSFNPGADHVVVAGSTLIVLGERSEIEKLRAAVG